MTDIAQAVRPQYRIDFAQSHTRYKNAAGQVVPGVTTVLAMLPKPGLLRWAWQCGRDGQDLDAVRQAAADVGTVAHALCEAYLRNMELDRANITPEVMAQAEVGFHRFLAFWRPHEFRVVSPEVRMVSERLQVGGTADVVAINSAGEVALLELKTSRAIYDEMLVQAAVYAEMFEEVYQSKVDHVYVVRIGKADGEDLEIRSVSQRAGRVAAFAALVAARRALQHAGVRV